MTPESLRHIRSVFSGIALPVMGCYVSASDRDPSKLAEAKTKFKQALSASVLLGAGCVGSETTHFTFPEAEREAAYARLLDFTREVCAHAEQVGARVGIEPGCRPHTEHARACRAAPFRRKQPKPAHHSGYGEPGHAADDRP